jgi:hypothetical protein
MSHAKIHEHHQTMTRLEVAVELRRLATQLEWEKCIPYGDGTIAVPYKIERELEIDESVEGGAFTMNFKLTGLRTTASLRRGPRPTAIDVVRALTRPGGNDQWHITWQLPMREHRWGSRRRGMRNHQSFQLAPATSPNRLHNKALTPHP